MFPACLAYFSKYFMMIYKQVMIAIIREPKARVPRWKQKAQETALQTTLLP